MGEERVKNIWDSPAGKHVACGMLGQLQLNLWSHVQNARRYTCVTISVNSAMFDNHVPSPEKCPTSVIRHTSRCHVWTQLWTELVRTCPV